jgi:hypothetical protein
VLRGNIGETMHYTLRRKRMDDDELVFHYSPEDSFERNFRRWFMMNRSERAEFGEQAYSQEEGLKVFKEIFQGYY